MTEAGPRSRRSSAHEKRPDGPARSRIRDRVLWILLTLLGISVVAYFVAKHYYDNNAAFDCFPGCTFKQDLSNYGQAVAFWAGVLLAIGAVVRSVQLVRRS